MLEEKEIPERVRMRPRHLIGNDHVQQRETDIDQNVERQRNLGKRAPANGERMVVQIGPGPVGMTGADDIIMPSVLQGMMMKQAGDNPLPV
ncbi:hypothetical protein AA13594_3011 [Gluconacetobacter azotocaptans DSM 13594]|nr:hypothetical protein AA13594_3011 [Gluconacetobacter azotocaptans DSM 13594]